MNTATITLRLTVTAAAFAAVAGTLVGCATARDGSTADGAAAQAANRVPASVHDSLVRSAADRYVEELSVRAELAARSPHEAAIRYVKELEVRADLASRSAHEEADRYVNGQSVRARMAAASDAPGWTD